jgi:Tautomerase enzyme
LPFVRIDLRKGKSDTYRQEVGRVVYEAMLSVGVPKDDRFQVIAEHDSANFVFDPNYLGIRRTEDLVIIQITLERGAHARAEEGALRGDRRRACRQPRPAPGRRLHQPGRGQKGELVIRQWGRAIRLSYSQIR